jgi:hypothetical protein
VETLVEGVRTNEINQHISSGVVAHGDSYSPYAFTGRKLTANRLIPHFNTDSAADFTHCDRLIASGFDRHLSENAIKMGSLIVLSPLERSPQRQNPHKHDYPNPPWSCWEQVVHFECMRPWNLRFWCKFLTEGQGIRIFLNHRCRICRCTRRICFAVKRVVGSQMDKTVPEITAKPTPKINKSETTYSSAAWEIWFS